MKAHSLVLAISEEVIGRAQRNVWDFALPRCGVELQKVEVHELINSHDSSFITTSVAVIWRTENCHDVAVVRPVISIHYQLVSTSYSRQVICVIKLFRNVLAERVACTSWGDTPTATIVGVGPKQVAHGAFLWHLLNSVELSNLIEGVNRG